MNINLSRFLLLLLIFLFSIESLFSFLSFAGLIFATNLTFEVSWSYNEIM